MWPTAACRRVSAAGSRSRSRSPATRKLLLLDEPHAGLDEDGRAVVDEVLAAAPAEGRTVLDRVRTRSNALGVTSTREVRIAAGRVHEVPRSVPSRVAGRAVNLLRDSLLVAGKDLRIERRSRVAFQQMLPFGGIVLIMFAFALDPDRGLLARVAPGLFWTAVLLASLLAVGRAFAIEDGERRARRLAALRARRRRDLPRQGRGDRRRARCCSRSCSGSGSSCSTTSRCAASC